MDRAKLRSDLVRDEGLRLAAYKDTNNVWTIGVGHALGVSATTPRVSFITQPEAMAWLDADINIAIAAVYAVFPLVADLTASFILGDARERALANMAFNRGETNMRSSTTITPAIKAALEAAAQGHEDTALWGAVSEAILTSPWGKQIGERGARLAYMFANGKDMA